MGRTILITSQFLQFLRQSASKYNATYKNDIQLVNTPGAQGADNGFLLSVVQRTIQSLALQYVPRGVGGQGGGKESCQGEQQEVTWTNLQAHHTSFRVGLLVTTNAGIFPRPNYKRNPQSHCPATFIPTTSNSVALTVNLGGSGYPAHKKTRRKIN